MSREIRRVPLDFDFPRGKTWTGYIRPAEAALPHCPDCENGYSPRAQYLHDLWYGNVPFHPGETGCEPLRANAPAVRAYAKQNVTRAPGFYGAGERAVTREARRLAELWNGLWCHHLTQDDVDALVAAGRLMDFTHTWKTGEGWRKIEPPVTPSAAQVNEWSLHGMGHGGVNESVVVGARCAREGVDVACPTCGGTAEIATEEQRADRDAARVGWERTDPPVGEGWQLWQTVSEGGPVSPVFADSEALARWLVDEAGPRDRCSSMQVARRFVAAGWAPSGFSTAAAGYVQGPEFVGRTEAAGA